MDPLLYRKLMGEMSIPSITQTNLVGPGLVAPSNNNLMGTRPTIGTGKKLLNMASGALDAASGLLGGPMGWIGLGVKAIGDNIGAARSQFDMQGFQDTLNNARADYIGEASNARNTSDLLNLAENQPDFTGTINSQDYEWNGNPLTGIGALIGKGKTKRDQRKALAMQEDMQNQLAANLVSAGNQVSNISYRQGMANFLNNAAMGGQLSTHGSDFSDGLTRIDTGGSHESNPLGGVPAGVDPQGIPNLVEEGETIWDDYVFSDRLKAPKPLVKKLGLGGGKKGLTYAEASKKIAEKSGANLRPNDPISKRTEEAQLAELEESQEEKRMKLEKKKLIDAISQMNPDELQGLFAPQPVASQPAEMQAPPQEGMEEPVSGEPMQGTGEYEPVGFALGGHILSGTEGESRRQIGSPKEANSTAWSTYTLPGVQKFFNDLIAEYNKAGTDAERQAIRRRAIDTVNKIQTGYRDIYNEFDGKTANYSDAVKAHQQAFADAGGNYGFAGGNGIKSIDDALNYSYTGHTKDNAGGNFTPDGLYGWRTAIRNFGSDAGADAASIAALANQLDLDWTPTIEYGNKGNKLYTLSEREAKAPVEIPLTGLTEAPSLRTSDIAYVPKAKVAEETQTSATAPELKDLPTWMRYAPIVGGGLSVLGNAFSSPNYQDYDDLIAASRRLSRPVNIPVVTIGDRIRRNPFDERLAINQANQNFLAGIRSTLDNAGGNRAYRQFANNLMAYNNQGALSEIGRNAYLANRQDALQTADFNRGTAIQNMNAINQRNLTQTQLNSNREQAGLSGLAHATQLKDTARRYDDQFVDADFTGFLQSLGNLGRENEQRNWLTSLAREGILNYAFGPKGSISFIPGVTTAKCGGKIKTKKRRF